jgi:hypothetical protein
VAKPRILLEYDDTGTRSPTRRQRVVAAILTAVVIVPIAREGGLCCYAQWCEAFGSATEVRTPIFDAAASAMSGVRESLAECAGPSLMSLFGDRKIALPFASISIVLAMLVLKRQNR